VSAWDDNARHYYYNTNIDGIYYKLNSSNNTACVSYMCHEVIQQESYRGGIEEFHFYKSDYSEDVMIPSEVTYEKITYNVTSIDSDTFSGCSDMTSMVDGKITFNCETPEATYHWNVSCPDGTNGSSSTIQPITLNVYATKSGYQNSDVTTYKFPGINGDVDCNGVVNVADHVKLSEIIMGQ
jgi:hypothetical protein